jgi:hypothetical protein
MDVTIEDPPTTGFPTNMPPPNAIPHRGRQPPIIATDAVASSSSGRRQPVSYADIDGEISPRALPKFSNPFEDSSDEDENPKKKAPKSSNPFRRPEVKFRALLPEQSQWILTADGTEAEFKALLTAARVWTGTHGKEETAKPVNLAAVLWRHGHLQQQKRLAMPVVATNVLRVMTHYPKAVQSLIAEWQFNPKAIHPWIRDSPDMSLNPTDLDITAWVRAIRPKREHGGREFYSVFSDLMARLREYENHSCWRGHEQMTSQWLVETATK